MDARHSVVVALSVRGKVGRRVPKAVRTRLVAQLERAMAAAKLRGAEVALTLVDDAEIFALNRDYADEDHATDVLSFSQDEGESIARAPGTRRALGDIVISVDTAARQAKAGGRTLFEELFHLSVHGLVHLLGYDHATKREETVMFAYEAKLRALSVRGRGKASR